MYKLVTSGMVLYLFRPLSIVLSFGVFVGVLFLIVQGLFFGFVFVVVGFWGFIFWLFVVFFCEFKQGQHH